MSAYPFKPGDSKFSPTALLRQTDELTSTDWALIEQALGAHALRLKSRADLMRANTDNVFMDAAAVEQSANDYDYRADQMSSVLTRIQHGSH